MKALLNTFKNVFFAITPLVLIVTLIDIFIIEVPFEISLAFYIGAAIIMLGQTLFLYGIDGSIISMGKTVGANIHKLKKIHWIILFGFIFGLVVTLAEPSVQILASQVSSFNSNITPLILIIVVSIGVGVFVGLSFIKTLFNLKLKTILFISYIIVFLLVIISPNKAGIAIAFDSGGVTTGPITVPFILALCLGVSNIRSKSNSETSFGMISLASIGPIISVLILNFIFPFNSYIAWSNNYDSNFLTILMSSVFDVLLGFAPLIVIFIFYNLLWIKLPIFKLLKILINIVIAFVGLVLFLTGINYGLSNIGFLLGNNLINENAWLIIVLVSILFSFIVVYSEPAIVLLGKQVEEATSRLIKGKVLLLSIAIALSLALISALLRVVYEIDILYFLIPLYTIAICLLFVVNDLFIAIAFDSGGIATGPMTSAFIVPFIIGLCSAMGHNILLVAFGTVSLVAVFPIIDVEILGLIVKIHEHVHRIKGIGKEYLINDYNYGDL